MSLIQKRDEAIESLRELESQHRQLAVEIERYIGRITTLNELIEEETNNGQPQDQ